MASCSKKTRLNSTEIKEVLGECESDEEFNFSDEDEYIPMSGDVGSDEELAGCIENDEDSFDSDDSQEIELNNELCGKDGTRWLLDPYPEFQPISRNILRQRSGPAPGFNICTAKYIFKSIMSKEMCDIILRETNRKGKKVTDEYNRNLVVKYPNFCDRPNIKIFTPFVEEELDAFFGILIFGGVHKSNSKHLSELWKPNNLPLFRAAMSHDRFRMLLRFIRFDNDITRATRTETDKAAAIRDIWTMLNENLCKSYKPTECITVDEQLFGYRGRTRFTQYMPSKPEKYGIKIFWACDSSNSYPLKSEIYTGKQVDGDRQRNVGERIVLNLVNMYKNTGRNITMDNFFTSLQLCQALSSWNLTLVGTVRKNKRFLPSNMQPHKDR